MQGKLSQEFNCRGHALRWKAFFSVVLLRNLTCLVPFVIWGFFFFFADWSPVIDLPLLWKLPFIVDLPAYLVIVIYLQQNHSHVHSASQPLFLSLGLGSRL